MMDEELITQIKGFTSFDDIRNFALYHCDTYYLRHQSTTIVTLLYVLYFDNYKNPKYANGRVKLYNYVCYHFWFLKAYPLKCETF